MKALAVAVVLAFVAAAVSLPAAHAENGITVSISPEPIHAAPGEIVHIPLRVSNNESADPAHITITQRALSLQDEGLITVLDDPDPAFAGLALPTDEQTIDPGTYRDFVFDLQVPPLAPDTYLIGLLVSIRSDVTSSVNLQGQVVTFATLDIPGARDRRLHAELHLPWLHLGTSTTGQAVLSNVGGSSFNVWGEIHAGSGTTARVGKTLLAAGRQRTLPVSTSARWGIGREQVKVTVFHNIADNQTGVDTLTATVWIVHPSYIAEAITMLIAGALALIEWLLRRRRARRAQMSAPTAMPQDRPDRSRAA